MATPTYTLIDSTVLGSDAATVTFSSISGSYRDLVLVSEVVGDDGKTRLRFILNGDTGTNYAVVAMGGDGSTAASTSYGTGVLGYFSTNYTEADQTYPIMAVTSFMDYSATDKHTTILCRANQPSGLVSGGNANGVEAYAGRWANTAAVTSVEVSGSGFGAGSTFYLFGIEA